MKFLIKLRNVSPPVAVRDGVGKKAPVRKVGFIHPVVFDNKPPFEDASLDVIEVSDEDGLEWRKLEEANAKDEAAKHAEHVAKVKAKIASQLGRAPVEQAPVDAVAAVKAQTKKDGAESSRRKG